MKNLFVLLLICAPFYLQAQCKSLDKLKAKYKDVPNSVELSFDGNFLGMTNWIISENDHDQDIKNLFNSISTMQLLTIPVGKEGLTSKDLAKLKKEMQDESYQEMMVLRDGNDHINMLIKEKEGIISNLVMLIENPTDLTILDFSGAIDIANVSKLTDNINFEASLK